jgi:hypothetical protein
MALAASLKHGALSDHHRLIRQFEAVPLMITSMAIPDQRTTENDLAHQFENRTASTPNFFKTA